MKEVIKAKFGEASSWCTETVTDLYGVGVWKTIRALWPMMETNLNLKVGGNCNKIKF